jgi:hypothetical protein
MGHGGAMSNPLIYIPGSALKPRVPLESPGRRMGKPHGSHVAGLYEQRQTIWLCRSCAHKFDHKRHNYYQEFYYVIGKCDACGVQNSRNKLYVHESYMAGPGGRATHGHEHVPSR